MYTRVPTGVTRDGRVRRTQVPKFSTKFKALEYIPTAVDMYYIYIINLVIRTYLGNDLHTKFSYYHGTGKRGVH